MSAPVVCVPDIVLLPDHAPLAVHAPAFVEDQDSVEEPPEATLAGDALSVTLGVAAAATVTVTDLLVDPPLPVQVSVYVESAVSGPVVSVPDFGLLPDHEPVDAHDVARVLDHVSVEEPPEAMLVGAALNVTPGSGAAAAAPAQHISQHPIRHRRKVRESISRCPI